MGGLLDNVVLSFGDLLLFFLPGRFIFPGEISLLTIVIVFKIRGRLFLLKVIEFYRAFMGSL